MAISQYFVAPTKFLRPGTNEENENGVHSAKNDKLDLRFHSQYLPPVGRQGQGRPQVHVLVSKNYHRPRRPCSHEHQEWPEADMLVTVCFGVGNMSLAVLGSCGAYVSANVSFDQPSFDVWLASTLEYRLCR
jgi:hypothetical protein